MRTRRADKNDQATVKVAELPPTPGSQVKNPPPDNPVGGVFVSKSIKRTATIEVDGSVGSAIDNIQIDAVVLTTSFDGEDRPAKRRKQTHDTTKATSATQSLEPAPAPPLTRNRPPFCCGDMTQSDPNCLYICDNATCRQRQACILFAKELKSCDSSIPNASTTMMRTRNYIIQALKYIPKFNFAAVTVTRLKTIDRTAQHGPGVAGKKWEVDNVFSGPNGKFYVAPDRDQVKTLSEGQEEDDGSIWYEVGDMGQGPDSLNRLGEYTRLDDSLVSFQCEYHVEERWVCVMWEKVKI